MTRRFLACLVALALICSGCWGALVPNKWGNHPIHKSRTIEWLPAIKEALEANDIHTERNVEIALAVIACESGGRYDDGPWDQTPYDAGLLQFTPPLWATTDEGRNGDSRYDPYASIRAMAEVVARQGWRDWNGGPHNSTPTGLWGSGPRGHGCWRYV